ncbi:glycosyltransferase [Methylococcus capsulatus]|jgi:glycosyltransferase involved in cell wall biosynthesis|uniref:Glycosyl transferase, group 2 family protein n=1 Tax=Methylococcus capsulatus (strain ATCC 33009 / NCIMB 11132 / Bath) TaxID=243233 RepID=Q608R3_METCA|nr:glycosyltransferase [Methylococcus capsulatus]AAU92280.1 glycosyl transferase, group 2 family protein [Methylococcus capsulatus str. Bath]QXP90770.1 glycosyltransferase [Methylococcus capsulatus]
MTEPTLSGRPLLSVVVIGRNEGERLSRCLASVRDMRDPGGPVEIIYVDSASRDDSVARARAFGAKVIEVKPERPSAALGRNAGWREAKAPYLLFLDGDTVLHPDFVADSLPEFDDPKVAVVWGHRRELHPEQSLFNRVLDLDWIYPPGPSDFCGGDALMRADVVRSVGGFDASLIAGEEPEMCQRIRALGFTILHVDRPMTGHDLAMKTWASYWKRAFRAGYAYAEVSERLRHTAFPLWLADARRNLLRGGFLSLLFAAGVVGLAIAKSMLPPVLALAFFLALALRSAWKARWKGGGLWTLLLYGIHSHLQQIPILAGQIACRLDRLRHHRRFLIEYK